MKRVLITGANGFIGKNLCSALDSRHDIDLIKFDVGNSMDELVEMVRRCDVLVHLAGVNRPVDPSEFNTGNAGLTRRLVDLLLEYEKSVPFILTSSIQASLPNDYGVSKKAAEDAVFSWARDTNTPVYVYRLPNVFGKWSRPNYNSVVATFCHNIAHGMPIRVDNPSTELTLVYIDDVVQDIVRAIDGQVRCQDDGFCRVGRVFKCSLERLARTIQSFADSRVSLVVPDFSSDLDRFLYATYISYSPETSVSYALDMKHDSRGWLAEFIKSASFGQIFISRTKPGITRGNHWHQTKVEKFLVIEGEGVIRLRKIGTSEVVERRVTGERLEVVDIPAGFTHSITNVGSVDMLTLFWADEVFDPNRPDTTYLEV